MRIVLIDVFALLHRSFHALPQLTTPQKEPIGAVYGFTTLILKALKDIKPDSMIAALDLPEPTFRQREFPSYQATRPPTPSDLRVQIDKVKQLLEAFGVSIFASPGFEADDVIGSLVEKFKQKPDIEIIVLTGDLDVLQLTSDTVRVCTLKKGLSDTVTYDSHAFKARFGFEPEFLPDYKGLIGDKSDNIPGVPGIGPKTAQKLIKEFGSLERLYGFIGARSIPEKAPDFLTPSLNEKLLKFKEQAFLSKRLATIRRDVQLESVDKNWLPPQLPKTVSKDLKELFDRWGFKTILSRLESQGKLDL